MADEQHLALLEDGVDTWNYWREANPDIWPDLSAATLSDIDLSGVNLMGTDLRWSVLRGTNLSGAYLSQAHLFEADVQAANLTEAYLFEADLGRANFSQANLHRGYLGRSDLRSAYLMEVNLQEADLRGAYLIGANLSNSDLRSASLIQADLQGADLRQCNLQQASLIGARLLKTNLEGANLVGCSIYGISAWGLNLTGANQLDLTITLPSEPRITVDSLEVAQLVHLFLTNPRVKEVFYSLHTKFVLILGRFAPDRTDMLDALKQALRRQGYLPVVFHFEKLVGKEVTDTLFTLASMAHFAIADITKGKAVFLELQRLIPKLPAVPVQILWQSLEDRQALLDSLKKSLKQYPSVLPPYQYATVVAALPELVARAIAPAAAKARELRG